MQHWTTDQWAAFSAWAIAGCCAVALLALAIHTVRGWTAPAPLYRRTPTPTPRPTLALAAARDTLPLTLHGGGRRLQRALIEETQFIEHPSLRTGADVADALQPGVGSLAGLPAADPELLTDAERAAAEDAWITAGAAEVGPALAEALDAFRCGMEPVMRKARLWLLQGEEGHAAPSARIALDDWRINTPTGEYPIIVPFAVVATGAMTSV